MFNGVDVTFNLRNAKGITFSGGTSTGKVENDWCDIRAAVPESFLLNPYCNVASPWQTSFRGLVAYTIPRIDVQLSTVIQDKPNVGTEQLGSLAANYTLTAADQAAAAAQIGRPLTATGPITVNLPRRAASSMGRASGSGTWPSKKILRFGGTADDARRGHLQPAEQQRDARASTDGSCRTRPAGSRRRRT